MRDERRKREEDRRKADRRKKSEDRRRAQRPMVGDRRTRFTLAYFVALLVLLIGINYFAAGTATESIAYSELKQRIAAGQIEEVVISGERIRATLPDTLRVEGQPEAFTTTRVPDDDEFIPLLETYGVTYSATPTRWFGQALSWMLPVLILILFWFWMIRRIQPGAQGVMTVGKNKARIMGEEGTGVTFDDVAGADEAKQELMEVVSFLQTPEKFTRIGAKIPKGVLLAGPPGTGKTLLARAVAGEAGVTFFSINGSEFVEMFVGVGASRVRDLFEQAKANAPCIVFIDELDALGKARGGAGPQMGGNDEREQTLNQLLVEMDGFDPRRAVIIMAATNRPEILDPALLRPGRFDRQVVVDRPDRQGREAILHVHAKGIEMGDDVDLEIVARRTPGFSGADLANVLNEAALLAARRDSEEVLMIDVEAAIDRIIAGLEKRNRLVHDREREIVAYHEAGHAIVAERVDHADPVHKISIIPRGVAALGYTQQLPEEDRYLIQRMEMLDRIAVLLGGRAAEEIVYGEISSGAGNDLERATDLARRMVAELGMSAEVGPVALKRRKAMFLPDEGGGGGGDYSEATARLIDSEIRRILVEEYDRAIHLLRGERDVLEQLAQLLLEQEVVEREELRELLGKPAVIDGEPTGKVAGHVPDATPLSHG
jgi:cell division protease FtsH